VAASLVIEQPYPTKPIDIVAEVLSPEDRMSRVFDKCRHYGRIGIAAVFVLDPALRYAWKWEDGKQNLERVAALDLPNGKTIQVEEIWKELSRRIGA
jgi:Uma2 family endonuclease